MISNLKPMNHKIFCFILLISSCWGLATQPIISNSWVAATSGDNPPYEFYQRGVLVGFDIDLVNTIAQKAGVKVTWKDMDFSGLIPSLQTRRADIVPGLNNTPQRQQSIDFSHPYLASHSVLLTLKASADINALEDLTNKLVGVQLGTYHEEQIKKQNIQQLQIKPYNKETEMIQDLKIGINPKLKRIDGIIVGGYEAQKLLVDYPEFKAVILPSCEHLSLGFRKGFEDQEAVNAILEILKADGTVEALKQKWKLAPSTVN
jgi:ABC-type amino acid transport substrate-binding protein